MIWLSFPLHPWGDRGRGGGGPERGEDGTQGGDGGRVPEGDEVVVDVVSRETAAAGVKGDVDDESRVYVVVWEEVVGDDMKRFLY